MAQRARIQRVLSPRRQLLEAEGLSLAPRELQQFFWARYNSDRRNARRRPVTAGEVAGTLVAGISPLDGVAEAWKSVAPQSLAAATRVLSLRNGVLLVEAADSSARFALRRFMGAGLLARLNQRLGRTLVVRIDCRTAGRGRA